MPSSRPEATNDAVFGGTVPQAMLGVAYVAVGIALFYTLTVGSTEQVMVVLLAVLALIALSLAIVVAREGLLTPENKLIGVFVLLSMGLLFGLTAFTDLPEVVVYGVVIVVGVLVPNRLLERGDDGRNA